MTEVKVLIEGYAKEIKGGWLASSTTTLIREGGKKIIVDPGINRKLLIKGLKDEGLKPKDIDVVYMTHSHVDHVFLSGIFTKAVGMDGETIYDKDKETEYSEKIPDTDIEVLSTPGHDLVHSSLVVKTEKVVIVIAGDVFWWVDGKQDTSSNEALLTLEDPFVKDKDALLESRKKVLEISDYIIPGYGKMFKSPAKSQ